MRDLSPEVLELLSRRNVRVERMFEGRFSSETLRLWSGFGPLEYGAGTIWDGNGYFQGNSNLKTTFRTQANGMSIKLTGIPEALLSLLLNDSKQAHKGLFYLAFFDDNDVLFRVVTHFIGFLDTVDLDETGEDSVLTIAYESQLIRLRNEREPRWTDAMQQASYPGDVGFQYVAKLEQERIYWGRADTTRGR